MSKLYLMNSAVLTTEGTYQYRKITPDEAKMIYETAKKENREIISAIGYDSTASYMTEILDDFVETSRISVNLAAGDIAIICKLHYRVADPALKKSMNPKPDDFEWGLLTKLE